MNLESISLTIDLQQLISTEQAWHYGIIPKEADASSISLYAEEEKITESLREELEILLGKSIVLESVPSDVIRKTLGKYYRKGSDHRNGSTNEKVLGKDQDYLEVLITEAKNLGSSDIHIESYEEHGRVRFRIDGQLVERYKIVSSDYPVIINKIKIKANLDIAEKRLPQDGRIHFQSGIHKFDIRVSALPTLHGEKIVLRLLSNDATNIDIESLGFSSRQLKDYKEGIQKPHGIVLISGPTGSGKTTTLYATLKILNKKTTNILTIEDPIEYTLEGINQVQLKETIGLTFASALRTFLRQDPDVIMVGEIRDVETAKMAIRAALTGHLVLSTIHTNSAWGIISRLIDMGIPPYLLSGILNTAIAQRLVRLLCKDCREEKAFSREELPNGFNPPLISPTHFVNIGCEHCHYTGYKGRKAVYEVIGMDKEFCEQIKHSSTDINDLLQKKKIETLSASAYELFNKGETSLEEIYPILSTYT